MLTWMRQMMTVRYVLITEFLHIPHSRSVKIILACFFFDECIYKLLMVLHSIGLHTTGTAWCSDICI